jgi:hypothetical protein
MVSAEYKAEAVRLVGNRGKSIGAIAWELGAGRDGLAALGSRRRSTPEEVRRGP